MADAISFAGIKGLPAPFDDGMDFLTGNLPPPIVEATSFIRCGYDFVIFDRNTSIPDLKSDTGSETLEQELPQIISPITPQSIVFNQKIKNFVETVWSNSNAPTLKTKNNLQNDDYYLWAGTGSWDNEPTQDMQNMLPNVISIRFVYMDAAHGAGAGRSVIDFNWLLAKERPVKLSDIFDPSKNWRKALNESVNAQRPPWPQGELPEPDLSARISDDPTGWLLRRDGIELVFGQGEFDGSENGGELAGPVVPWSSLKPALKKGGLVAAELNSAP
jgi:hypothetical protein